MEHAAELAFAGACYAAALLCSAGSWRTMLPSRLGLPDALTRYGVGSLANTLLPGRAGDALRIGLFGRVVPGGALAVVGAVAAAGTAAFAPLPIAWLLAARGSERARRVLAPLRCARAGSYRALVAWVAGIVIARVLAAAAVADAFAVPHPVATAVLVVPALELAGVVPLTPANAGIAGGAAALVFRAAGAPTGTALVAGLTLHGIETVTSLVVGAASAVSFVRASPASGAKQIARLLAGRSPGSYAAASAPKPM